jgi:hypothetical protein
MKKLSFVIVLIVLLSLTACLKKEVENTISLTNPQGKAVPFNGYYKLTATGDSVIMYDYTPKEYTFSLHKGEGATGLIYKDTTDMIDTLYLVIKSGDSELLSKKMTSILEAVQFQITAQ